MYSALYWSIVDPFNTFTHFFDIRPTGNGVIVGRIDAIALAMSIIFLVVSLKCELDSSLKAVYWMHLTLYFACTYTSTEPIPDLEYFRKLRQKLSPGHQQPWMWLQHDITMTLQWRHKERDCVSNHWRFDCLFNCLFRRRSKYQSSASLAFVRGTPHRWIPHTKGQ